MPPLPTLPAALLLLLAAAAPARALDAARCTGRPS